MNNVNDNYFDGQYKNIWKSLIPAELSSKEADFMVQHFGLLPGSRVLDVMCGYGRHALALGEKGIDVTAVDNLGDYIREIEEIAKQKKLPVVAIQADVMQYRLEGDYQLAICMGNSLNFFDHGNALKLLKNMAAHLRPGGGLFINTWSLAEIAIRSFAARAWSETNGVMHIVENAYLFNPTRIESESLFLFPDGSREEKKAVDYIFSVAEMESLLNEAGFAMQEIYSVPGKKKFALGDPRAYIVAHKA
jgi:SAM-dependent methyltransferase